MRRRLVVDAGASKLVEVDLQIAACQSLASRRETSPTHLEHPAVELVAVEESDRPFGVLRRCEQDAAEASTSSIWALSDIGTEDVARSSHEIFELLPLAIERQIADEKMPVLVLQSARSRWPTSAGACSSHEVDVAVRGDRRRRPWPAVVGAASMLLAVVVGSRGWAPTLAVGARWWLPRANCNTRASLPERRNPSGAC